MGSVAVVGAFLFATPSKAVIQDSTWPYYSTRVFGISNLRSWTMRFSPNTDYFVRDVNIYCTAGTGTGTLYVEIIDAESLLNTWNAEIVSTDCSGAETLQMETGGFIISPMIYSSKDYFLKFSVLTSGFTVNVGYSVGPYNYTSVCNFDGTVYGNNCYADTGSYFSQPTFRFDDGSASRKFLYVQEPNRDGFWGNATTTSPLSISGSCYSSSTVALSLSDTEPYAETLGSSLFSGTCQYGFFNFNRAGLPLLHEGLWYIHATDTNQFLDYETDYMTFHVMAGAATSTIIELPKLQFSLTCYMSGLGIDPCAQLGYVINTLYAPIREFLAATFNSFTQIKPYKYVFQIKDAVSRNLTQPTASTTLPVLALNVGNGHATTTFFDGKDIVPPEAQHLFTDAKDIERMLIRIGFLAYLLFSFVL